METIQICGHFEFFLFSVASIFLAAGIETLSPLIKRERHVGYNDIKLLQVAVRVQMLRVGQRITPCDVVSIYMNAVDEEVHSCHRPGRTVHLLPVNSHLVQVARLAGSTD